MADNNVIIAITYDSDLDIRQSVAGTGEVETVGSSHVKGQTHYVVAGSSIADYAEANEIESLERRYDNFKLLGVERHDVSMVYRSPTYRL